MMAVPPRVASTGFVAYHPDTDGICRDMGELIGPTAARGRQAVPASVGHSASNRSERA